MFDKDLSNRPEILTQLATGAAAIALLASPAFAQDGSSGMTSGLPGVSPQRQAELMHIRAQAQAAKPEAEAAAMQRSAEKALDQQANQRLLDEARETKRLKEEAARNLEFERAANAFRKVSRNDIRAYNSTSGGRVKVEQDVPADFLASLPEEEVEEKKGLWPFGSGKKNKPPKEEKDGLNMSWIPFVGKKKDDYIEPPSVTDAPQPDPNSFLPTRPSMAPREPTPTTPIIPPGDPQPIPGNVVDNGSSNSNKKGMFEFFKRDKEYVPSSDLTTAPVEAEKEGFFKKMGSGLSFGKKKEEEAFLAEETGNPFMGAPSAQAPVPPPPSGLFGPQSGSTYVAPPPAAAPAPAPASSPVAAATPPPLVEEKKGMFSGLKNFAGKLNPMKKNDAGMASGPGAIDSSLFPQTGEDTSNLMADTSNVPKEKKKLKMPSLPNTLIPSPSVPKTPEPPKPPMPKKDRSPIHSGGSDLYVVDGGATQFLRFGSSQMGSETMSLQPGTIVRMTKVGDEWSSVKLSDGSTGIVRNKALRPANSGESGSGAPAPPIASTNNASTGSAASTGGTARITRPVSATGAGTTTPETPGTIGPPVSIPESRLTTGTTNSGLTP